MFVTYVHRPTYKQQDTAVDSEQSRQELKTYLSAGHSKR